MKKAWKDKRKKSTWPPWCGDVIKKHALPKIQGTCGTERRQRETRWRPSSGLHRTRDISFANGGSHIPRHDRKTTRNVRERVSKYTRTHERCPPPSQSFGKRMSSDMGASFTWKKTKILGQLRRRRCAIVSQSLRPSARRCSLGAKSTRRLRRTRIGIVPFWELLVYVPGKTIVSLSSMLTIWKWRERSRTLWPKVDMYRHGKWLGSFFQWVAAVDKFAIRTKSDLFDRSLRTHVIDPSERQLDENQRRKVKQ